jgi:predicted chitinase
MILKLGNKGPNVGKWQAFLNTQGLAVTEDADFGARTESATIKWQKKNGLSADGRVGPNTLAKAVLKGFAGFDAPAPTVEPVIIPAGHGITPELLAKIFPGTKPASLRDRFIPAMNNWMPHYGIDNRLEVSAFIATGGVETDYLRVTTEYASGAAYEGRKDLGNIHPGDGKKFPGHGFFQTTGRYNHRMVTQATFAEIGIDFEKEPKRLAEIDLAIRSACIFYRDNGLGVYANAGDFFGFSGKVNRGSAKKKALHYDKRLALYNVCLKYIPKDFSFA